jgi:hypothetical protein
MEKILKILLWLLLVCGLGYATVATYVRVFNRGDYLIRYNISCDPSLGPCFSEEVCDESGDKCETNYYSSMQRIRSKLALVCGSDILTCPPAETCMKDEVGCVITFCNPSVDNCTTDKAGTTSE